MIHFHHTGYSSPPYMTHSVELRELDVHMKGLQGVRFGTRHLLSPVLEICSVLLNKGLFPVPV